MKLSRSVGVFKTWLTRLQTYIGLVNFFMLFFVFIQDNKWFSWYVWCIIIFVVLSSILFIDIRFIMGQALGYQWEKNKSFARLEKKVDRLMEEIGLDPDSSGSG